MWPLSARVAGPYIIKELAAKAQQCEADDRVTGVAPLAGVKHATNANAARAKPRRIARRSCLR